MADFPLDKYKKKSSLGRGAQGEVKLYKLLPEHDSLCSDRTPKRVAVKTLTLLNISDDDGLEVHRELDIIKSLKHTNIVSYLGQVYVPATDINEPKIRLIMELCQTDLSKLIRGKRNMSLSDSACIIGQILEGLEYLHGQKVIHRDLKPANVLLVTDEENPNWKNIHIWQVTAKLADFGYARPQSRESISFSMSKPCGSIYYMAPEMAKGFSKGEPVRGNWRLDIFSVGVIAYQLLTGEMKDATKEYTNDVLTQEFQRTEPMFLSFLNGTLCINVEERKSATELLKHEFITNGRKEVRIQELGWQNEQMRAEMDLKSGEMGQLKMQMQQMQELMMNQMQELRSNYEAKFEQMKGRQELEPKVEILNETMENVDKQFGNTQESSQGDLSQPRAEMASVRPKESLGERVGHLEAEILRQAKVGLRLKDRLDNIDSVTFKNHNKIVSLQEQNDAHDKEFKDLWCSVRAYESKIKTEVMPPLATAQEIHVNASGEDSTHRALTVMREDMVKLLEMIEKNSGELGRMRRDLVGFEVIKSEISSISERQKEQDKDVQSLKDKLLEKKD